jgi:hypothetical protein
MELDSKVWGPHYWFVFHTITLTYPNTPNDVTKKKYYDFIQNIPLFIPNAKMGNQFSEMLDLYPVTPYLDSRESFSKWMLFIHNKINLKLNLPEITMAEAIDKYYHHYKPKDILFRETLKKKEKFIFLAGSILLIGLTIYLYKPRHV